VAYNLQNQQAARIISGKSPFVQDPAINYDLDSEEELAEAQGEDLNS
jgi:hypothetical protein